LLIVVSSGKNKLIFKTSNPQPKKVKKQMLKVKKAIAKKQI